MNILLNNYPHSGHYKEDSFLSVFHWTDQWDETKYWELEKDILKLIPKYSKGDIPRDVALAVVHVTSAIMTTILAHFNPDDGWTMQGLTDKELHEYYERLRILQLCFFLGETEDLNLISDTIHNPLL